MKVERIVPEYPWWKVVGTQIEFGRTQDKKTYYVAHVTSNKIEIIKKGFRSAANAKMFAIKIAEREMENNKKSEANVVLADMLTNVQDLKTAATEVQDLYDDMKATEDQWGWCDEDLMADATGEIRSRIARVSDSLLSLDRSARAAREEENNR